MCRGKPIEWKIERIVSNKEPISDGAPEIFTERKEGVKSAYNIRTDRWEIATEAMSKVEGSIAENGTGGDSMFMTLNRRYEQGATGIDDLTTYVYPSKYNNIFAQTSLDSQNFWVQISNKITARRKMSAKVIPNL